MKKTILMTILCLVISLSVQAELTLKMGKTEFLGGGHIDCIRRVQITSPGKPNPKEIRKVTENVYKITRTLSKPKGSTTIFIYIDGMPIDQAAYAVGKGTGLTIESYRVNEQQYEFWKMVRN